MSDDRGRRGILLVAATTLLLALPFLGTLPLFDPDEGYYPACAAESLRHGHPLDPTLNGEPRWNKPPLSYALMQGAFFVLGTNEFAARLPSVVAGAALVAILGLATARAAGGRAGIVAAAVLASSLGFQVMTRAAHPEMALVLGTAAAQALLALWFVAPAGERPGWAWWAAGLAMGFGFLAKGPSTLAMPALMLAAGMLVVPREGRPSWGEAGRAFGGAAALALAVAAPWFLWMGAKHGDAFWRVAFGQMEHLTEERHEGFRESPLFFVPVLAGAFLPWVLFLPSALRGLRRSDPSPGARFTLLMALAAGTSFLFWSLSASKNPHYALVFLPPLAAVVGAWIAPAPAGEPAWFRRARFLAATALAPALLVAAAVGLRSVAESLVVPPHREMARRILRTEGRERAPVAVYRLRLPSLSFYLDREVPRVPEPGALREFLDGPGVRFLVTRSRDWMALPEGRASDLAFDDSSGNRLLRFEPAPSPPPPARGGVPPGGAPPPGGGPR